MFFTFNATTGNGAVMGEGWNTRYVGFSSGLEAWAAVNRDGFALAPATELVVNGDRWTAKVVRG